MSGRVAVVTGASSGIGLGCAKALAADGHAVALLDLAPAGGPLGRLHVESGFPTPHLPVPPPDWTGQLPWLGGGALAVALVGLVVFSVVSAYIYYPPRRQVFAEMAMIRADAWVAVRGNRQEEAIRRLEQGDLLTRKLQVGELLRKMRYDEEAAKKTDDLREAMEKVRDALLAGETEEAKVLFQEVEKNYQACREAHRE